MRIKVDLSCSFCGQPQDAVRKLIAGPTVFICDACVDVCRDIIRDDERFERRQRLASASAASGPDASLMQLLDRVAELPVPEQWALVTEVLARLRDGALDR